MSFRPLLATNGAVADPESWRREEPPASVRTALIAEFRRRFPKATRCRTKNMDDWYQDDYPDGELRLSGYAAKTGWLLVTIQRPRPECDGWWGADERDMESSHVYAVAPGGALKYLGANLTLVEAADVDRDGHSELVFAIQNDNRGGYALFSNDFAVKARFEFSFH